MRWGIMGTGGVANAFAEALRDVPNAELLEVGSRDIERARSFADRHGSPLTGASTYEALVGRPDVDVVYVATPASHHYEHAVAALRAGKHVLCEKPFAMNAAEARGMVGEAEDRGLFLMEAMWCRFLPSYAEIRQLVAEGAVGGVLAVDGSSGTRAEFNPRTRPFQPEFGGGALYDAAVYPVSFAQMILGPLDRVSGVGTIGASGVDEQCVVTGRAAGGLLVIGR